MSNSKAVEIRTGELYSWRRSLWLKEEGRYDNPIDNILKKYENKKIKIIIMEAKTNDT